jgi:hypothetical protein
VTLPVPGPPAGAAPVPQVAAALRALDGLAERPVHEHVERFDALHRALQDALATLDEA